MFKKTELSALWLIWAISILFHLIVFFVLHNFLESNKSVAEVFDPPIMLRTIFYVLAIIGFPVIKLVRYVMLQVSKTMPGDLSAKRRYAKTVITSMILGEMLVVFAVILAIQKDEVNNLYIFAILFFLAMVVNRPDNNEYLDIVNTLKNKND